MARFAIALLVLAGLVAGGWLADEPAPRADFAFLNRGDASTLDPAQMSWMQDFRVAHLLGEGLTRRDGGGGPPGPGVAERWEVSPDGRVYTFHLRGATWSNGAPVRAQDFVFSWRRSMLPETGADYVALFGLIRGGREFTAWRAARLAEYRPGADGAASAETAWREAEARFTERVGIEALDDLTLRVTLERPTPYFVDLMGFPAFYPVYPARVLAYSSLDPVTGAWRTEPGWTLGTGAVTNGPFVMEAWRFKRDMRFRRRDDHWRSGEIALRTIAIPSIQDGNAQVLAFTGGVVDWTSDVPASYVPALLARKREFYAEHADEIAALRAAGLRGLALDRRLPADPRNRVHAFPSFGTYFYNFNCRPRLSDGRVNPLADARVRRALALCVDKRSIVEHVRRSGEPTASTLIPPGSIPGYRSPSGLGFDPARARALLDEVGHAGGAGLGEIELLFNSEGGHGQIAQAVAAGWTRELGVRVRLVQRESKVFGEDVKRGNFMVSRATWFGDYPDPTTFLDLNTTGNGNNDRGYSSAAYDGLLARAADESDVPSRLRLLEEAERLLVEEDLPLLPLYQYVQVYLFDPHRVEGISEHPLQDQHLDGVRVLPAR